MTAGNAVALCCGRDGVSVIGEAAFYGCSELANIDIPTTVKKVDKAAFWSTACTSHTHARTHARTHADNTHAEYTHIRTHTHNAHGTQHPTHSPQRTLPTQPA